MKVVVDWGSKRAAMKRGERRKFLHSEGRKLMISSYKGWEVNKSLEGEPRKYNAMKTKEGSF